MTEEEKKACREVVKRCSLLTFLFVVIFIACGFLASLISHVEHITHQETRVSWKATDKIVVDAKTVEYFFDRKSSELVVRGAIDEKTKEEIISSFPLDDGTIVYFKSFVEAMNQAAFESNKKSEGISLLILLLGGVAGIVGVQLRSITNYIGHACWRNDLELNRWWPYYVMRPISGFVLGAAVVAIIQAGLLTAGEGTPGKTLWWVGICFLAGFGEEEVAQRLRHLTKSLFGASEVKGAVLSKAAEPPEPAA